jgi:hypothetical protein
MKLYEIARALCDGKVMDKIFAPNKIILLKYEY